jgi:DUF4097 and DUF4098 domain-containing protein YvlB
MKMFLLAMAAGAVFAQTKSLACDNGGWGGRRAHSCEVREQTVGFAGRLTVDGGTNGGVSIKGWDGAGVLVRARIDAQAADDASAKALASQVRVDTSAGQVHASGPENGNWSVSYEIFVPRNADLTLKTHNGGLSIADVKGNIQFDVLNGGVSLKRLGGDVEGSTVNGGLNIELAGTRWEGAKLDARTRNGGINIALPENYSAHFESATVNGHVRADYPMTVHGNAGGKRLTADLGSGGPTVHVETTNGGVTLRKL